MVGFGGAELYYALLEIFIFLAFAEILHSLTQKLGLPQIVADLVAGIVLSVYALGGLLNAVLPVPVFAAVESNGYIQVFAEFSVVLLLFAAGLSGGFSGLRTAGPLAAAAAILGDLVPFTLTFLVALWFFPLSAALLIGVATAATSAAVSASLIQSERVAGSLGAKFYINVAAMDDVVALILLSIVLTVVGGQFNVVQVARGALESVAAWLILLLAAVFIIPRVLRLPALRTSRDVPFVILFLLVALVTALGFSAVIGAYIAGLAVAESLVAARTRHLTEILLAIFGSLFFVVVGASFNIRLLADPTLVLLGGLFALLAIVGKFVGIFPFALRRLGTRRDATAVAVGMLPRGEIGLIVAALGASPAVALLDSKALGEIILMAIFTTIVGAFLFRRVVARTGWAAQAAAAAAAPPEPGVNLP